MTRQIASIVALATAVLAACSGTKNPPRAPLTAGVVEGSWADDGTTTAVFRGIPYAAPPVGELRWRAPVAVKSWDGVRAAREFGAACPQSHGLASHFKALAKRMRGDTLAAGVELPTSEDCLTLNVWTSNLAGGSRQPVMVWVHGGSGTEGSGRLFDGGRLARKGVVVVTINYRLGILGFMKGPSLAAESREGVSGNYALRDQIAALEWVRANARAFGGDSSRVTVFGQSAGATLIANLLTSPSARGLFQRVVLQSGTGYGDDAMVRASSSSVAADRQERALAKALGVDSTTDAAARLRALRSASPEPIVAAQEASPDEFDATPSIDGVLLPVSPPVAFANGSADGIDVMLGLTSEEMAALVGPVAQPSVARIRAQLEREHGRAGATELLRLHRVASDSDAWRAWLHIMTDEIFGIETRGLARTLAARGNHVFSYEFTRQASTPAAAALGAYHSADVAFVFNRPPAYEPPWTRADSALADTVQTYWANFARTGNPGGNGVTAWPAFTTSREEYLDIGMPITVRSRLHADRYAWFERSRARANGG
jgi:para-nitrobenzyl esterase